MTEVDERVDSRCRGKDVLKRGPIVVVGNTCTGKTSLGSSLASVASDIAHVSVGALFRAHRESANTWPKSLESSYAGLITFPPEYILGLIAVHLAATGKTWAEMVLDGGPPVARVLAMAGIQPALTIVLVSSDETRRPRFELRHRAGDRDDDLLRVFIRRSEVYARHLPETIAMLSRGGPVLVLDAGNAPNELLQQAPSAVLLLRSVDDDGRPMRMPTPNGAHWEST